jgi:hypothetical protein
MERTIQAQAPQGPLAVRVLKMERTNARRSGYFVQQHGNRDIQASADFLQSADGYVFLSTLDFTHVRAMNTADVSKFLL